MKKFKFKINGKNYNVEIEESDDNKFSVNVNGTDYSVEMEEEIKKTSVFPQRNPSTASSQQTKSAAAASPKPASTGKPGKTVNAPLPGNILEIKVKRGEKVKTGDVVLIMEAMKMENNVTSEHDGVVSEVLVNQGQAVMQNDVLIEIH